MVGLSYAENHLSFYLFYLAKIKKKKDSMFSTRFKFTSSIWNQFEEELPPWSRWALDIDNPASSSVHPFQFRAKAGAYIFSKPAKVRPYWILFHGPFSMGH